MDISVIICTCNRSQSLLNTLNSFKYQVLPANITWEIIVVDNNSIDDTKKIIEEFKNDSDITVKYVMEKKQGLSYARNRGIDESSGKYLCFTDDDVLVDKNWLCELLKTFKEHKADCVGGKILPKWINKKPKWLEKELYGFLALLDHGNEQLVLCKLEAQKLLFGANISFIQDIFKKVGFFNIELGRKGNKMIGGEEIDLLSRILNSGGKIIYQPTALVCHVIGPEKLKKHYFRKLHYYDGLMSGKFFNQPVKRQINGVPLFVLPQLLKSIVKYFRNPTLRRQMNIWWYIGFIKGRVAAYRKE